MIEFSDPIKIDKAKDTKIHIADPSLIKQRTLNTNTNELL